MSSYPEKEAVSRRDGIKEWGKLSQTTGFNETQIEKLWLLKMKLGILGHLHIIVSVGLFFLENIPKVLMAAPSKSSDS